MSHHDLTDRLRALGARSRVLDPGPDEREGLRRPVLDYVERFLDSLPVAPAYQTIAGAGRRVLETPIPEAPVPVREVIELLATDVDPPGLNAASGGHFGYIPGGGIYTSALGDYLADVFNRYVGVRYASPGGAALEQRLIDWMRELAGFPPTASGFFTSGGSHANLAGIVAARDAAALTGGEYNKAVAYLTSQTHHSVAKALRIAGLREAVVREVPVDERWRMRPEALSALAADDRSAGLRPWLVVSSAGTTDVGAVDPLDAIADVARAEGLWHHVDGAYGAFFILTDEARDLLRGMERADSLVMDPHKTLFLPYGSGVLLVRDRAHLLRSFQAEANYMQDAVGQVDPSIANLSPELTRPFRGLRLWLPLLLHGLGAFRAALEEKLLLARYFHARVGELGYQAGPAPDLSVVTYRYIPPEHRERPEGAREEINALNRRILHHVVADGRSFISSTMLDGWYTLRMACVVHRTHLEEVEGLLERLAEASAQEGRE